MRYYIGIDNGVTGSIGIIAEDKSEVSFWKTPIIKQQDYTKAKKNITRINGVLLKEELELYQKGEDIIPFVLVERPMVDPTRFVATTSALRALEATLITLEMLNLPYQFIDSKEWQKELLPKGIKGSEELKKASHDIGCRLFPTLDSNYHTDFDGLLIAEYARRKKL